MRQLVKAARARGEELIGPKWLLKSITETVLEEEMTEHPGHVKHAPTLQGGSNVRNSA